MTDQPLLLDLFCGAGGATRGYQRAGFRVVGVDIKPQPNYCGDEFHQADAIDYCLSNFTRFDAFHGSPPCQHHTTLAKGNNNNQGDYPDFIEATRAVFSAMGRKPYVIENVPSSPLVNPITLCGEMFGLNVIRHRLFESNVLLMQPPHVPHRGRVAGWRHGEKFAGPYVAVYGDGGGKGTVSEW